MYVKEEYNQLCCSETQDAFEFINYDDGGINWPMINVEKLAIGNKYGAIDLNWNGNKHYWKSVPYKSWTIDKQHYRNNENINHRMLDKNESSWIVE